ncbi:MAG: hypothetical protein K9L30_18570 [Desulfobacterales bacterium]|nr:hypothetical protein [Desulfobacterales bacterium]
MIYSDELNIGDKYETLKVKISRPLNLQFLNSLGSSNDERFDAHVHPGVLFNFCSITQSPSFKLEDGLAAVGAKFETVFYNPLRIEETYIIDWEVIDVYEKRSRTFQVCKVIVRDASDAVVMKRKITNTFIGGKYLEKRVKWEKKEGYRSAVPISDFPKEGYSIVGEEKRLTIGKLRNYSGGLPGPTWPIRNIHTDREISIRSGVGKPIASGMMFESYLFELLYRFCGDVIYDNGEMATIAIHMAGDGDVVTPKMVIIDRYQDDSDSKYYTKYKIWCENQYSNKVMIGEAIHLNAIFMS